jgi:PAS domain S-box-containing protein
MTAERQPGVPAGGPAQSTVLRFRKAATAGSAGVAIVAVVGLVANVPSLQGLGAIRSDDRPIAPIAAVILLFFLVALLGDARKAWRGPGLIAILALVLGASVFSLLVVVGSMVGREVSFGGAAAGTGWIGQVAPSGMSPATGFALVLAGAGVLLLLMRAPDPRRAGRFGDWAASLGTATAIVGATGLLAYLYGAPLLTGGTTVPMPAMAALAVLFLGAALAAAAGPESFPARVFVGDSTSARLSRVFLPLCVGLVLLQGITSVVVSMTAVPDALFLAVLLTFVAVITAFVVGRVSHSIGRTLDASNRRLKENEERHRVILETANDGYWLADSGGRLLEVNAAACRLSGYTVRELLGMRIPDLEGAEAGDAVPHLEDEIAAGRARFETRHRRKDGSSVDVEVSAKFTPIDGGRYVAFMRDITERKAAEEKLDQTMDELRRSNEELGQFAYIASHDLQEPLRMVASYTQLLSKRYKGRLDADADEFIAFATDGANRMQRLIEDLLAYSRVGTKGADPEATSSEAALEQALVNLRGAVKASGAVVTHEHLPIVWADEMQLTQVFQNLVGNAIKYHGAEVPRVHICAAKDDGSAAEGNGGIWDFSVSDNGMGIDPQYFGKIFGVFQRLHKRDEFAGTGIGLAICKKIVERHGGTISVESQPGLGSTFHFSLSGMESSS